MAVPEQGELELGDEGETTEVVEAEVTEGEPEGAPEVKEPDPVSRYEQKLQEEREARIRLEERLAAAEAKAAPPKKEEPPQEFTRAQLREAVNEGTINEDQMEDIWAKQLRNQTRRDTEELLTKRDAVREKDTLVSTETQKYIDAYPGVAKQGSDDWQKVKKEYDFLIKLGDEHSDATQLKALRAAFGSSERVVSRNRASEFRETASETASPGGGGSRPVDIFNQIPQKYRAYYKGRYEEGQISLEDIKKDLPYMGKTA